MGGAGSGRKPTGMSFIPKRRVIATIGSEPIELPNHSGDNSAGKILKTPVHPNDIPNKSYVDTAIGAIDLSGLVPYTGAVQNVDLGPII